MYCSMKEGIFMYIRLMNNFGLIDSVTVGVFDFPVIESIKEITVLPCIPFNIALSSKKFDFGVHFFIDDYQFERFWNYPGQYINKLKKFEFVLTPDFSLYTNMPKAMQIWNRYRSQFLGAYMQKNGIKVIPTVSWSDSDSFNWCFDGISPGGIVAVSSVGCMKNKEARKHFIEGYQKMLEILKPTQVLFYGIIPDEIDKNFIYSIDAFQHKFKNKEK